MQPPGTRMGSMALLACGCETGDFGRAALPQRSLTWGSWRLSCSSLSARRSLEPGESAVVGRGGRELWRHQDGRSACWCASMAPLSL